jgi:hypothetical protein
VNREDQPGVRELSWRCPSSEEFAMQEESFSSQKQKSCSASKFRYLTPPTLNILVGSAPVVGSTG